MKLYKSTIVIWYDEDPTQLELSALALEAEVGGAYCSKCHAELVEDPGSDPDWDGTDFFAPDAEDEGFSVFPEVTDPQGA